MALAVFGTIGTLAIDTPTAEATVPAYVNIESHDGATIEAFVWIPQGPGPHPIIVMPASWSSINIQYTGTALQWADAGYVVVNYTARGWGSENSGLIDIAGPDTIKDVSEVIDFAIEHANGDPERVGVVGVSYGAGIGLLAAGSADENRIDAVVALSTWGDLRGALFPNDTINAAATGTLIDVAVDGLLGHPGPLLETLATEYAAGSVATGLTIADSRSPITYVDTLNERGVAVMIGNAWSDSIFPPSGAVDLFEALDGPKKLALSPGDHGGPELGALGIPTERMDQAFEWIEQHVAGVSTDTGPRVEVTTNDFDRVDLSAYEFSDLATSEYSYQLSKPHSQKFGRWWWTWYGPKHGELQGSSSTGWTTSIDGGQSTTADSQLPGNALLSGYMHGILRVAPTLLPSTLDRSNAAVWESPRLWHAPTIAGSPELSITVRPEQQDTTFFVYLYEKNLLEVATLVTHKAYTIRDATPGQEVGVTVELEPTMWDMERGSRLYMVVDTVDPRYLSETTGGNVRFESPHHNPAQLTVPFR